MIEVIGTWGRGASGNAQEDSMAAFMINGVCPRAVRRGSADQLGKIFGGR